MNTEPQPSPLVPQGQLLDAKNKGRARVKIAVFFVLAVHGIGLMALLMQGCRREEPAQPPITDVDTNSFAVPTLDDTNAAPMDANYVAPNDTNMAAEPLPDPMAATNGLNTGAPAEPPPLQPSASEYKVVAGDTYFTIAKKFKTSSKAIAAANPNVDPTRLKIGQALQIPAPSATTQPAAATNGAAASSNGGKVYTVVSGDTLTKIASKNGVTVKALRSANNLTTDRITVGQKLKIPAKASAQ